MRADFSALFYFIKREKEWSDMMKKTVKPSPVTLIVSAIILALYLVAVVVSLRESVTISFSDGLLGFFVVFVFGYSIFRFLFADRIEFDENTFTVDESAYYYSDITDVRVNSEEVARHYSTLRINVYIGEEEVCSFTKNDKGAKEFIECLKKHGVAVSIEV